MSKTSLRFLEPADLHLLLDAAPQIAYHRGDEIMKEGVLAGKLYLILQGYVRVEHKAQNQGFAVARLGPGEVLGEMGFLKGIAPTASVIADEEVQAQELDAQRLTQLIGSDAGFASRLYRSLAVTMAERLQKTTHDWATAMAQQQAAWRRFHLDRTLQLSERQLPPDLVQGVAAFRQALQTAERSLGTRQLDDTAAQERISAACDHLRDLVEAFTQEAALVAIGYDDPLAMRTPQQMAEGVGVYVLREVYPLLMTSATMARCYTKPRGYPEDPETRLQMYEDRPEGDGRLGRFLDRWFLSGPVCAARRQGRQQLAALLEQAAASAGSTGPLRITSLACGSADELFDFLRRSAAPVYATGVDSDTESLQATAKVVSELKYEKRVTLVRADVVGLLSDRSAVSLPEQHVIYAHGLGDYLDDAQFKQLLSWAYENLQAGGIVALAGLNLTHADQGFLQHILEWELHPRSEARLRELVSESSFKDHPPEVSSAESGVLLVAKRK